MVLAELAPTAEKVVSLWQSVAIIAAGVGAAAAAAWASNLYKEYRDRHFGHQGRETSALLDSKIKDSVANHKE